MATTRKQNPLTKMFTIVALSILILTAFTFMLAPNEAADSTYVLRLKDWESKIKLVGTGGGDYVEFEMELYNNGMDDSSNHEVKLEIVNDTYSSGSPHWDFTFTDADTGGDTYYVSSDGTKTTVTLRVTFLGTGGGERVTFTIIGRERVIGGSWDLCRNHTHLSPRDCYHGIEYLTVASTTDYNPFWEPSRCVDRKCHAIPCEEYMMTIWNLGSEEDNLSITGVEVWLDVNENGVIDAGDTQNGYFNVTFEVVDTGLPYYLNDPIVLGSLESEELYVTVMPEPEMVPVGYYLVEITVASANDGTYVDALTSYMSGNPAPCALTITICRGWNMISIGVGLDSLGVDYRASHLAAEINGQAGADIIKYVVKYNRTGFHEYVADAGVGDDFLIKKNEGYYLYSESPFCIDFTIVGDCPDCEKLDIICDCWSLIGWASMETMNVGYDSYPGANDGFATNIEEAAPGDQPVVQAIIRYDRTSDPFDPQYEAWYPGLPNDLFLMEPGYAYWVFVATRVDGVAYP